MGNINIFDFVKCSIEGVILGIVFLILALLVLPELLVRKTLNKMRPKILDNFKKTFCEMLNLLIKGNAAISYPEKQENFYKIKVKNEAVYTDQKILFAIDSVLGIFQMLSFILYKDPRNDIVYDSTVEYLDAYCNLLRQIAGKPTNDQVIEAFKKFSESIDSVRGEYESLPESLQECYELIEKQQNIAKEFYDFILELKDETEKRIEANKEEILRLSTKIVGELTL